MNKIFITIFIFVAFVQNSFAWNGYDWKTGQVIEIGKGNLVRDGSMIEFYDWNDNEFHNARVIYIDDSSQGGELKVFDIDMEKDRIFDME
ncbi:DUF5334 family protein [Flavobacteriaceae bacterium]|nr:DUF5334 family protein [Flavobacteriaceae bacterium]